MAEKDRRVSVPIEEVVMSNVIQGEALVRLLVRKGLLTQEEVIDEIRAVRDEMGVARQDRPAKG